MLPLLMSVDPLSLQSVDRIERHCLEARALDVAFKEIPVGILDECRDCRKLITLRTQPEKTHAQLRTSSKFLQSRSENMMRINRLITCLCLRPRATDEHQQRCRVIFLALCLVREEDEIS